MSDRRTTVILFAVGVLSIALGVLLCVINPGVITFNALAAFATGFGALGIGFACMGAKKIGIAFLILTFISAIFSFYVMIKWFLNF